MFSFFFNFTLKIAVWMEGLDGYQANLEMRKKGNLSGEDGCYAMVVVVAVTSAFKER